MFKGDLDVGGGPEGELKGDLDGDLEGDLEVDLEGDLRGDFKLQTWKGTYCQAQLRSRSGLVQVWFSLQLKFSSSELDSEVGRLVLALRPSSSFIIKSVNTRLSIPINKKV